MMAAAELQISHDQVPDTATVRLLAGSANGKIPARLPHVSLKSLVYSTPLNRLPLLLKASLTGCFPYFQAQQTRRNVTGRGRQDCFVR